MSDLDLTEAVEAAARALWEDGPSELTWETVTTERPGLTHAIRNVSLTAVTAAAPLIEAQVRERVAQEILDANRAYECDHSVEHGRDNYPTACVWEIAEAAAAIARGGAS